MSKLTSLFSRKPTSKTRGKRFLTSVDMSSLKLEDAILNSKVKRGEAEEDPHINIVQCGCGMEGCFIYDVVKNKDS